MSRLFKQIVTSELSQLVLDLQIESLIPTTIGLVGELGAGKTTLVKAVAESLGVDSNLVSSPSYNLVNEYQGSNVQVEHWDLYRLDSLPEELNYQAETGQLRLVEWSNLIEEPEEILDYQIEITMNSQETRDYLIKKF